MVHYIKRFWKENLMVVGILFAAAVSQTIASLLNATALNALIALDVQAFLKAAGGMFVSFLFFLLFTFIQINQISRVKQKMLTAIREDITIRMEHTSYTAFHERQVGTYASWLSNDMNTIESEAFDGFYNVLAGVIASLTSVAALFYFHWSLVVWSFAAAALTLLLPKLLEEQMGEAALAATQENERFLSKSTDALGGFDTLFSYGLLKRITSQIKEASIQLAQAKNHQALVVSKVAILGAFGNVFGQLSILVLTGFLAFQSLVSIGSIATTGNFASVIFNTVGNISQQIASVRATQPIFEKFQTIPVSAKEKQERELEATDGFQLKDVGYAYGEKRILSNVSFDFSLRRKYAIVGASGSGKTTLLNMLNGKLTDYDGSITFSGKELKDLSGNALRDHILYIDQTPYLFEGTIRENILLGETFTEEELQAAIRESDLDELIRNLPDGLGTHVGEAGRLLSGGQRQRLALARGLIRGKTCILLDEGTSSMDEESAVKIEKSLLGNPKLTVIMITHHLRQSIQEQLDGVLSLG